MLGFVTCHFLRLTPVFFKMQVISDIYHLFELCNNLHNLWHHGTTLNPNDNQRAINWGIL